MSANIHYQGDDQMIALMSRLEIRTSLPEIKAYLMRRIWENQAPLLSDVVAEISGKDRETPQSEPFREQIMGLWNDLTRHRSRHLPFCFQKFALSERAEDLVAKAHWRLREVRMLMPLF